MCPPSRKGYTFTNILRYLVTKKSMPMSYFNQIIIISDRYHAFSMPYIIWLDGNTIHACGMQTISLQGNTKKQPRVRRHNINKAVL